MTIAELIRELEIYDLHTLVCVDNGEHEVNIDEVVLEIYGGWKEKVVLR